MLVRPGHDRRCEQTPTPVRLTSLAPSPLYGRLSRLWGFQHKPLSQALDTPHVAAGVSTGNCTGKDRSILQPEETHLGGPLGNQGSCAQLTRADFTHMWEGEDKVDVPPSLRGGDGGWAAQAWCALEGRSMAFVGDSTMLQTWNAFMYELYRWAALLCAAAQTSPTRLPPLLSWAKVRVSHLFTSHAVMRRTMKQQQLHSPRGAAAYHIRNVTVDPKETLDRQRDGYVQWCVVLFTPTHQPGHRLMLITSITANPPLSNVFLRGSNFTAPSLCDAAHHESRCWYTAHTKQPPAAHTCAPAAVDPYVSTNPEA